MIKMFCIEESLNYEYVFEYKFFERNITHLILCVSKSTINALVFITLSFLFKLCFIVFCNPDSIQFIFPFLKYSQRIQFLFATIASDESSSFHF